MSCGTCGIQASNTMQGDTGVPAGAPQTQRPRCPHCKAFIAQVGGGCNNPRCPSKHGAAAPPGRPSFSGSGSPPGPYPYGGLGTGPVAGAELTQAGNNLPALLADAGLDPAAVRITRRAADDTEGRFGFRLEHGDRHVDVLMPGLALDQVRFVAAPEQHITDYPRLYVDGSSWIWSFAATEIRRLLAGVHDLADSLRAIGEPALYAIAHSDGTVHIGATTPATQRDRGFSVAEAATLRSLGLGEVAPGQAHMVIAAHALPQFTRQLHRIQAAQDLLRHAPADFWGKPAILHSAPDTASFSYTALRVHDGTMVHCRQIPSTTNSDGWFGYGSVAEARQAMQVPPEALHHCVRCGRFFAPPAPCGYCAATAGDAPPLPEAVELVPYDTPAPYRCSLPPGPVRELVTDPQTGQKCREIEIAGQGVYRWNAAYRTYNHQATNRLLDAADLAGREYTNIPTGTVKKRLRHPETGRPLDRVYVPGQGWFRWNTAFKVYNSDRGYAQLRGADIHEAGFAATGPVAPATEEAT